MRGQGLAGGKAIPFGGGDPRAIGVSYTSSVENGFGGGKKKLAGWEEPGGRKEGREFI